MSKLHRLKLCGIRNFGCEQGEEQEIKFSSPVTLFLGQNGTGKTTIIEAIKFAVTGDLPGGTKSGQGFVYDPHMTKKRETTGQVRLKFINTAGTPISISKLVKVKSSQKGLSYQHIESVISEAGEIISDKVNDVHKEACIYFGVSKAILNNVIFCHQEESLWPFEESSKLKKKFDAIFDTDKYNKCIEHMLKIKKDKSGTLSKISDQLDTAKLHKEQAEKKRSQLEEKKSRYAAMLNSLEDLKNDFETKTTSYEEISSLEMNFNEITSKINEIKTQFYLNINQQREILSHITELDCSDDELKTKLATFEISLETKKDELAQLAIEKEEIENKENEIKNSLNEKQIEFSELQAEIKGNDKKIKSRNTLMEEMIENVPINIDISDINAVINIFENYYIEYKVEKEEFDKNSENKDKELQKEIDKCRIACAKFQQESISKTNSVKELQTELVAISQKLSDIESYRKDLEILKTNIMRNEKDLSHAISAININALKTDIENSRSKEKNIEEEIHKLNEEIKSIQDNYKVQTDLNFHKKELTQKMNYTQDIERKHEENFKHIFEGKKPEKNIKQALEKYIEMQEQDIQVLNNKISDKEKEIDRQTSMVNFHKKQLETIKNEYESNDQMIKQYFKEKPFECVLKEINDKAKDYESKKSLCKGSSYFLKKYLEKFKQENPSCPLCSNNVIEKETIKKIISDIEDKLKEFKTTEDEAEIKLCEIQAERDKIYELKPTLVKSEQLQEDIRTLNKTISTLKKEKSVSLSDLNCLKNEIEIPEKNKKLAESMRVDVSMLENYEKDIQVINGKIAEISLQLSEKNSDRNMEDALNEQRLLQSSLKIEHLNREVLTNKLEQHKNKLQTLQAQKNDLKLKEINIKEELQENEQLQKKEQEIKNKILVIEKEIQVLNNDIKEMENNLDNAIKNKERWKITDKKKKEKIVAALNAYKTKLDKIISLNNEITDFTKGNVSEKIISISKSIEMCNQEINQCSEIKLRLTENIDELKDQILNKKTFYRDLQDNVNLRKKKIEARQLIENLKIYEKKLNNHDPVSIQKEKLKLEGELSTINQEIYKTKGEKEELKKSITDLDQELAESVYANADENYKSKFIESKLLEYVIEDIGTFAKAVDKAMLQYHMQQMVQINDTIKELWRTIYRGNDIDYIEIKTQLDTATYSDKRRMYQYHLVQVKNDVEIEMRGRCSVGQKVLASLIIRIALADTFGAKCGILALDEPTANLDRENIDSLCQTLCDLISRKKKQENFQLLIITHDQEFLEKLSRTVLIEQYYLVTRNEQGKSIVTVRDASF